MSGGPLSKRPSQDAIRLTLGGFLLLLVEDALLLSAPDLAASVRLLIGILSPLAVASLVVAVVSPVEPQSDDGSRRHAG